MELLLGMSLLTQFLFGCTAVLVTFVYWLNRRQDYFKNFGIPYTKSPPLLGSFGDAMMGRSGFYDNIVKLYNKPEVKGKPFFGMFLFHKPGLMINDPELIKRITVKDFSSFTNRYVSSDVHDPLGYYSLFSLKNPLWKGMRGKLSPFFSSGKLKSMYYLIDKNSNDMITHVEKKLDNEGKAELEMKHLAALYTTDVIANCAYGVEANSLENPDAEFRKAGEAIFNMTLWRGIELPALFMLPQIGKLFNLKMFSTSGTEFIKSSITHVMEEREKRGNKRNDLIDTLIELKNANNKDNPSENVTMDMLMGQAAVFFAAGFETSSATQSFALYHVAKDDEIQEKLRSEIREMLVRTNGKVTYDAVMNTTEMPYLNQVFHETLRLYPILPVIDRECVNPDGYSLEPFSDFKIPYGMPVYVPFHAIQRDEKNFPEPMKFDPERFSPENINNIKPFTNFPFGSGPRNCIGERFGLMQVKTGIVKILKEFRLETTPNTPETIVLGKKAMLIQSEKGLFLNLVKDPIY